MTTYITTKVLFEELTKKVNRIFKKLDSIGATKEFYPVHEFVKEVPVYNIDQLTQTKYKVGSMNVECVEYVLNFTPYRISGYKVGCVVEQAVEGNLVYTVDEAVDFRQYTNTTIRCDHCKTNHKRNKAVVLIHEETGKEIMVGTTCLKDFIGYNVEMFYKYFYEIQEWINQDLEIPMDYTGYYKECLDITNYLANCIKLIETYGYNKELKFEAFRNYKKNNIEETYVEKAKKVIEFFNNFTDTRDSFEHDTMMFVTGKKPITGANGFIAYAYELYKKIVTRIEQEKNRLEAAKLSNFVGTKGTKITVTGTIKLVGGYETRFGYTRIYKFVDNEGNIYIWKTSGYLEFQDKEGHPVGTDSVTNITITGTIKDHTEYKEEKQTVLTRCKVITYKVA